MATIRGSNFTSGNTGTEVPGAINGDLICAVAVNFGASIIPALPSGWTSAAGWANTATGNSYRAAYIVRGSSAPSYVFVNATSVNLYDITSGTYTGTPGFQFLQNASSSSPSSPANSPSAGADDLILIGILGAGRKTFTDPTGFARDHRYLEGIFAHGSGVGNGPYAWGLNSAEATDAWTWDVASSTTRTKTVTFDAALATRATKTVGLTAALANKATKSMTFGALLAGLQSKTVSLSAATAVRVVVGGGTESDDTGAVGPSSVDQSGANTAWTNINNSLALDGSYATCATVYSGGAGTTNSLDATFPDMDIPEDATIVGIEVAEHAYISAHGSATYISSAVTIDGQTKTDGTASIGGTQTWDGTLRTYTYGGPTDLWGGTWTPSDFTAPVVSVLHSGGDGNPTFQLDYVSLKIYYSVEAPAGLAFDAALGKLTTKAVTLDSMLTALRTLTATIDAALATPHTKSLTADAALADMHTLATTLDAVLANHTTKSATLDAALATLRSKTVALDAALAARPTKSLTFDAALFGQGVETISLTFDAVLQGLQTVTMTLDAALATPHTAVTTFDTLLAATRTLSTTLDVVLAAVETETVALDASLADVGTEDVNIDAVLAASHVTAVSLDVLLSGLQTCTVELTALLAAVVTKTMMLDAALAIPHTKTLALDGMLLGAYTVTCKFDALIGYPAGLGPHVGLAYVQQVPRGRGVYTGYVPVGRGRAQQPAIGRGRTDNPGGDRR